MEEIRMRARAKINLTLDVTGKREDGYHLLRMVMQNVALYDDVMIRRRQEAGIVLTSNLPWLPCDERNLAWRAARLMQEEFGLTEEEMKELLSPSLYIGRCSEQVEAFLEKVRPLIEDISTQSAEIQI